MSTVNLKVKDVLRSMYNIPVATSRTLMKEALESMTEHRLGIVCQIDDDGRLEGVFTDGDLRRMLLKDQKPLAALFSDDVADHVARNPLTVGPDMLLSGAVRLMEEKEIWDIPVTDSDNRLIGLLHLHPAIKAVLAL
jgi:CBS domain-containing protein